MISEQIGAFLAPVPYIEGAVATRALARAGEQGYASLGALIAEPVTVSTVALRPAAHGTAKLVPSGAVAGVVVAMDADDLVVVADLPDEQERPNLGCSPLADRSVRVPDRSVLAQGIAAHRAFDEARDEWRVLMSGALVGLGEAALALGVDYAKDRHQFGVPIGSFQSIARDLADVATLVDGARLLAREAAWARDRRRSGFPVAGLDGLPLRHPGRPTGQQRGPPCSRRLRVHARVRHPALLPPGPGVAPHYG